MTTMISIQHRRRVSRLLLTGLLLCLLLPSTNSTAMADTLPSEPSVSESSLGSSSDTSDAALTWGVGPAPGEGQPNRAAFVHPLEPGTTVSDTVRITNYSTSPLTFQVYAQDAINSSDGGFDLLTRDQASTDIGLWVRIQDRTVTVPARSRADVPFRIEVPLDATPGDHAGGIVAALTGSTTDTDGRNVAVEQRVGARIYGRVPGALRAELTVDEPVAQYAEALNPFRAGATKVTYTVRNNGNVRVGAQPSVRVSSLSGRVVRTATGPPVREVLPGQAVTVVVEVPGVWPLGRLTVDASVEGTPVQEAAGDTPEPQTDTARVRLWALPWTVMVLLLLMVLFLVLTIRNRRSRRQRSPIGQGPADLDALAPGNGAGRAGDATPLPGAGR